jgi:hypothetical protein
MALTWMIVEESAGCAMPRVRRWMVVRISPIRASRRTRREGDRAGIDRASAGKIPGCGLSIVTDLRLIRDRECNPCREAFEGAGKWNFI